MDARTLAKPKRGSAIRPTEAAGEYRSIIAMGGNGASQATSIADAGSATLTFTVSEAGWLDRLVVMGNAAAALAAGTVVAPIGAYVTSIKHNNDELVTGAVPATVFGHDSQSNPPMGHYVRPSDSLTITIVNQSGATAEYGASFICR
jgi:hypothetical protein